LSLLAAAQAVVVVALAAAQAVLELIVVYL
jgi:hypothetical protein